MKESICIGFRIVLDETKYTATDTQVAYVPRGEPHYLNECSPAGPIDSAKNPFVVMTTANWNRLQSIIDETGHRQQFKDAMLYNPVIAFPIPLAHTVRLDAKAPMLNECGRLWKDYAKALEKEIYNEGVLEETMILRARLQSIGAIE